MRLTTKGRFAVTAMLDLALNSSRGPVTLAGISERQKISLSYLEQLFGKLRRHELVESTRGAHGGYRLARSAEEITMDEVVLALEGAVAPMSCFVDDSEDGRVLCSHVEDGHACATKLLWTRVQGGVIRALQQTTLQELVEFGAPRPAAPSLTPTAVELPLHSVA